MDSESRIQENAFSDVAAVMQSLGGALKVNPIPPTPPSPNLSEEVNAEMCV